MDFSTLPQYPDGVNDTLVKPLPEHDPIESAIVVVVGLFIFVFAGLVAGPMTAFAVCFLLAEPLLSATFSLGALCLLTPGRSFFQVMYRHLRRRDNDRL